MIVLVNPMLSRPAVNADSCYNVIRQFITRCDETRPDIMFDVMWPVNGKDWKYYRDGLFDLPRVRRLPYRFHAGKMKQVVTYDPFQLENFFDYKTAYDIIWNHAPEIGDLLKHHVPSYNASGKSVVVNAHHYVVHDSLPYPVEKDQPHIMLRQIVGSFGVDANVFDSEYCKWMLMDNAEKYASARVRENINDSSITIPHGTLNGAELRAITAEVHKNGDVFTFAYNHRMQAYKNYHTTFEVFDSLFAEGFKFRVVVFGMPDAIEHFSTYAKKPYVEMFVSDTREMYLRKLATCHANMLNSQHETFCISAVESMALGQLLIAPNAVTFPEITGKNSDNATYPFLFDTVQQQLDMCRTILKMDADKRHDYAVALQAFVWRNFNVDLWTERYTTLFDKLVDQFDVLRALKPTSAPIVRLIASQDRWDFQDLRKTLYSAKLGVKRMVGDQSFPSNRIKRLARQLGFEDARSARTGELMLVKRRDVDIDSIVRDIVTRAGGGDAGTRDERDDADERDDLDGETGIS